MLRTISMDIREEREDLKKAAEESKNAILELELDGKVKWVSPSWQDVTGAPGSEILGKGIAEVTVGSETVFADCVEAMRNDKSKSRIVRFSVMGKSAQASHDALSSGEKTPVEAKPDEFKLPEPAHAVGQPVVSANEDVPTPAEQGVIVDLEAQGIMVYDRDTGEESHTMWMVKPAVSREITIDLPNFLVESLGIGAEMLANYLTLLTDVGVNQPESHPPPLPVLCRICERQITPWWFEKHTELCAQEHYAENRVQMAQDALQEQRPAIVKVLEVLEAQREAAKAPLGGAGSPTPAPNAEYKGLPIGSNIIPTSSSSSGRSSPAAHVSRSRDPSVSGLGHGRGRSFAVRRPLSRIVELVLDLCDTAMEINTPSIKDSKSGARSEIRTQSPHSEDRISQVLQWQSPTSNALENEQGLAQLCDDTWQLAKRKVEVVGRHRRMLEYFERIRVENEVLVAECIDAAIQKAERVKAGELSDSAESSEESSHYETPEQQLEPQDETIKAISLQDRKASDPALAPPARHSFGPSALAMALRSASELSLPRRASSNGSSRTNSPHGAATPRSYAGLPEPSYLHKRGSIAMESDAGGESDSSMHSSIASGGPQRVDSPSAELSLSRVASTRSRERKRQSLVLPSFATNAFNRMPSPGRGPPPPASPLRMSKPRLPSGAFSGSDSVPSPVTSPVLTHSEFHSPIIRGQSRHHRRQSSAAMSDLLGRPGSPHLSGIVSNPQPRAPQTSIKDFEIIKPISKGAFWECVFGKEEDLWGLLRN